MSDEFKNRLLKNLKKRKSHVKSEMLQAWRLYERDIPAWPYIIDIYGPYAMVYEKGNKEFDPNEAQIKHHFIMEYLKELLPLEEILFKVRKTQEGPQQYRKFDDEQTFFKIQEGSLFFWVNLTDYLDTGLFLDHRPLRKKLMKMSQGKKALNLFSYTCALGVAMAKGGALTTNVDKSKRYLDWGKKNYELNQISTQDHLFINSDTELFLNEDQSLYDLIILDPPTFSNEKKKGLEFEVQRDHEMLVKLCMNHLNPEGFLFFSTNKRSFKLEPRLLEHYQVTDIGHSTIPFDFEDQKIHHCYQMKRLR